MTKTNRSRGHNDIADEHTVVAVLHVGNLHWASETAVAESVLSRRLGSGKWTRTRSLKRRPSPTTRVARPSACFGNGSRSATHRSAQLAPEDVCLPMAEPVGAMKPESGYQPAPSASDDPAGANRHAMGPHEHPTATTVQDHAAGHHDHPGGDRAVGHNVIALPIAAGVFEPALRLVLRPETAAALSVSGSSIIAAVRRKPHQTANDGISRQPHCALPDRTASHAHQAMTQ
jgi:hypothetical protein